MKNPKGVLLQKSFFLEGTDSLSADFHLHFLAVDSQSFGLQIRLPHLLGMTHRKAYVVSVLLALTCNFTLLHNLSLK